MRYVGVVQARMGSTRLPGKVLKPMHGVPMIVRLLRNLATSRRLSALVVATSTNATDDGVAEICAREGVGVHRGSETDVLLRLWDAAHEAKADALVRLTGDNPLVTGDLVDLVIDAHERSGRAADYVHTLETTGWPYGMAVELVTMAALSAALKSDDPADREHVTYYVRTRPDRYSALPVACPAKLGDRRVTVDTAEDFSHVEGIVRSVVSTDPLTYAAVLDRLESEREKLRA